MFILNLQGCKLLGDTWEGSWEIKRGNDTIQKLCLSGGYNVHFNYEDINTNTFTKHSYGMGHKNKLRTPRLIKSI